MGAAGWGHQALGLNWTLSLLSMGLAAPRQDLRFSPGRWTPGFPVCWVEVSETQASSKRSLYVKAGQDQPSQGQAPRPSGVTPVWLLKLPVSVPSF